MSEVALISARKSRLAAEAKTGNRSAATALELQNEPDRFLSTVQIGITLMGYLPACTPEPQSLRNSDRD